MQASPNSPTIFPLDLSGLQDLEGPPVVYEELPGVSSTSTASIIGSARTEKVSGL